MGGSWAQVQCPGQASVTAAMTLSQCRWPGIDAPVSGRPLTPQRSSLPLWTQPWLSQHHPQSPASQPELQGSQRAGDRLGAERSPGVCKGPGSTPAAHATYTQTHRQIQRHTDTQTDTQTHRHTQTDTKTHRHTHTDTQTHRQTHRQTWSQDSVPISCTVSCLLGTLSTHDLRGLKGTVGKAQTGHAGHPDTAGAACRREGQAILHETLTTPWAQKAQAVSSKPTQPPKEVTHQENSVGTAWGPGVFHGHRIHTLGFCGRDTRRWTCHQPQKRGPPTSLRVNRGTVGPL
jgi:hypothetical protein